MDERITPHLRRLIDAGSVALRKQFVEADEHGKRAFAEDDPLAEEVLHSPVKGIVHKYTNRALLKVSYRCAAHCQFCTRIRQIGTAAGDLDEAAIANCLSYIADHTEIDDVILSGGDPFVTPEPTQIILRSLMEIPSVKVVRLGTRLPIHSPASIATAAVGKLLKQMVEVSRAKPVFVLLHANHPDELTAETLASLAAIRSHCTGLLSQSVFLRGINDNAEILGRLFKKLYHSGTIPYYIFRCDYVRGLEHFVCDLSRERMIMTELRRTLSGIALPTYAADVPGYGKLPVPLGFWEVPDIQECIDFRGKPVRL